jgi:hypothetical protein
MIASNKPVPPAQQRSLQEFIGRLRNGQNQDDGSLRSARRVVDEVGIIISTCLNDIAKNLDFSGEHVVAAADAKGILHGLGVQLSLDQHLHKRGGGSIDPKAMNVRFHVTSDDLRRRIAVKKRSMEIAGLHLQNRCSDHHGM